MAFARYSIRGENAIRRGRECFGSDIMRASAVPSEINDETHGEIVCGNA
jgi:hypothetical protein